MPLSGCRNILAAATIASLVLICFSTFSPWFALTSNDDDFNGRTLTSYVAPAYIMTSPLLLYSEKELYGSEDFCADSFNTNNDEQYIDNLCQKIGGTLIALSFASVASLIALILSTSALCCPSTVLFHAAGGFAVVATLALVSAIAVFSSVDWRGFEVKIGMGLIDAGLALATSLVTVILGFVLGCKWRSNRRFRALRNDTQFLNNAPQVRVVA